MDFLRRKINSVIELHFIFLKNGERVISLSPEISIKRLSTNKYYDFVNLTFSLNNETFNNLDEVDPIGNPGYYNYLWNTNELPAEIYEIHYTQTQTFPNYETWQQIELYQDVEKINDIYDDTQYIKTLTTEMLDAKTSTRLSSLNYIAPDNTSILLIKDKTDTIPANLTADLTYIKNQNDYNKINTDNILIDTNNILVDTDLIKTKVESLNNYDDTAINSKLDNIKIDTTNIYNNTDVKINNLETKIDAVKLVVDDIKTNELNHYNTIKANTDLILSDINNVYVKVQQIDVKLSNIPANTELLLQQIKSKVDENWIFNYSKYEVIKKSDSEYYWIFKDNSNVIVRIMHFYLSDGKEYREEVLSVE